MRHFSHRRKSSRFLSPVSTVFARNAEPTNQVPPKKKKKRKRLHFKSLALLKQARLMMYEIWSCSLQVSSIMKTRRWGSVYLGVVVLRVWYFEHAFLQLKNCHHILPERTNPLLHLFSEPHTLYSMSQSTTKIVSFRDNVWKYAHLQCRHAWSQIAT